MGNVITRGMSKTLGREANNIDVLNTIWDMASPSYQSDIPKIPSKIRDIKHANIPYAQYEIHQNEFFNILVNRIGSTEIKALVYENTLGIFRSEGFEHGETLQEIYVNLAEEEAFDAKNTLSPFRYADTDIKVFYHDINRESKYRRTFERAWTLKAFASNNSFDNFIDKMFRSFLSSDQIDEYTAVRNVITNSLTDVNVGTTGSPVYIHTPATKVDIGVDDWAMRLNKMIIARSNLFAVPSRNRFENAAGVPMATPISDQFLIMGANVAMEFDSILANAFNMDKATVLANKIIVDELPQFTGTGELNGAYPLCALVSKNTIILKDKLIEMNNIYNPENLSYNYFLHHHELISYSLLENAHIFYSETPLPIAGY